MHTFHKLPNLLMKYHNNSRKKLRYTSQVRGSQPPRKRTANTSSGDDSGVARISPLLGHNMGTLRLYGLPREVPKLIGVLGASSPRILQLPRSVLRPYTVAKCKSLIRLDRNSVLYIAMLRSSISKPFSTRFAINNATISAAPVGHGL